MRERNPGGYEFEINLVYSMRAILQKPNLNLDSCRPQLLDSAAVNSWIWILDGHNGPRNPSLYQSIGARRGSTVMATRLEVAV